MISSLKPWTQTHFDWITCRFSDVSSWKKLLSNLGFDGLTFVPLGKPYDHFPHAEAVHNINRNTNVITVAWDEYSQTETYLPGMDSKQQYRTKRYEVLINLSGSGCDLMRHHLKRHSSNLIKMIALMYQNRGEFTRIDLNHDFFNFNKYYSAKYLAQQTYNGNLVTSARNIRWMDSFNSHGGNSHAYNSTREGDTLYIGRNPKMLRVYSKMAEEHPLAVNSQGVSEFAHSEYKSWQRWEIQVNGQYAKDMIHQFVKNKYNPLQTWTDFIKSNYRFITRKGQTKSRRTLYPTSSWFKKVIATGGKFEQTKEQPVKQTYNHAQAWIKRQVFPTLGNYLQARIEQVYQNCGSYDKAKRIVSRLFLYKVIEYLDDNCKYDKSLVDSLLVGAKANPIHPTNFGALFTKDLQKEA